MTVSEQIIQVLNVLCAKFGLVIDWTSENVIPYLGELCGKLVNYEIWTSVAWMTCMVLLSIISAVTLIVLRKQFKPALKEYDLWPVLVILGCVCIFMASIGVIGQQIGDIIKCVTFPEMYIVEYVQGLISSGG